MALSHVRFGALLLLLCLLGISFAGQPAARAQPYGSDALPAGVISAGLGGSAINLQTTPTLTDPQPLISGQVSQNGGTLEITITSHPITFTATVGSDGAFSARPPEALEVGQHNLYFDGALVGRFVIAATAAPTSPAVLTPAPPATGSGGVAGGLGGGRAASVLLASAGGLIAASSVAVARHLRRRQTP